MSVTHSLTFNDVTATITLITKPNTNQLEWMLLMKSGVNKAVTSGVVDIEASRAVIDEVKPVEPIAPIAPVEPVEPIAPVAPVTPVAPVATPTTTATAFTIYPPDEKFKHHTAIKAMLDECEEAKGKDNKALIVMKLFNYLIGDALEFTKTYVKFKGTVINKCYEFKQMNGDMPEVVAKANQMLIALGASTTIPADFKVIRCNLYGGNHTTPTIIKPVNTVVTPAKKAEDPSKDAPKSSEEQELALFTALAKKYDFKNAIARPKDYFGYFNSSLRWNNSYIKGSTKAEKMISYFNYCTDVGKREALMKTIFAKHGLSFNDTVMSFYQIWSESYKPTGKTNRYIKMNEFALAHKGLFTPIAK